MAKKPSKPQKGKPKGEDDPLKDEAIGRLESAREQKDIFSSDIDLCNQLAAPHRTRQSSSRSHSEDKPDDAKELCTSLAFEVAEDFMTMLIDSFMPQSGRWAERKPDPFIQDDAKVRIEREAKKQDDAIFEVIRGSNFHAELAKQGVPDGAIGVLAMTIKDPGRGMPPECLGVAISELEMNLGPDGRIDDRFIVRCSTYGKLPTIIPDVQEWPKEIARKIDDEPDEECEVVWAYWRLWDRPDETWQHVVLVDDERVHAAQLTGSGCCPLVIGRFGATPDYAWPVGPMIKSLPDLLQVDETDAAFIENMDLTLRPPFAYDDDGILNFEDGIEPGMGYPRRPGSRGNTMEKIWEPNPIDAAMFQHDAKQRRVRRLHYVDFPEQVGKTPPTASQWLDEMVEAQKKIGTPGYAFWREFPFDGFNRFRYILEKQGKIRPVEEGGVKIALTAYNPAQRAQENQEVLTASRLIQIAASAFPTTFEVAVDGLETITAIKEKLGDKLVKLRTPENLQGAAQLIAQVGGVQNVLKGGLSGGTPPTQPAAGAPAGASYLSGGRAAA